MPISGSSDNYVKLLAALLAAHPELKPNYHNIAIYFGDGATYDAIQGCMRRIRNKADELRKEVETGVRPNVTPKPTPKKRAAGTPGKGKKGFIEDDVDDEEILTPAKKKARLIEEGTPTPVKFEGRGSARKKAKGSATTATVIDISNSDDESPVLSDVKVKRETESAVVKTETMPSRVPYHYDSDDDYRE